ncbi:hypothetical protein GJ496_010206 [Pomphorhynchus laevis]|nr:hypothetical protein GJ496_010206 [Pomphorhynchus laevis]
MAIKKQRSIHKSDYDDEQQHRDGESNTESEHQDASRKDITASDSKEIHDINDKCDNMKEASFKIASNIDDCDRGLNNDSDYDSSVIDKANLKVADMDAISNLFSKSDNENRIDILEYAFCAIVNKKRKHDNFISAHNLQEAAKKLNMQVNMDEIQDWIIAADDDGNGEIDFAEFVKLMSAKVPTECIEHEIKETFKVFDKDNNGMISCSELCTIIKEFDKELTEEEAEEMIAVADVNKSGTIDLDELIQILLTPDNDFLDRTSFSL